MATPEQLMQIGQQVVDMNNQDKSRDCVKQLYAQGLCLR